MRCGRLDVMKNHIENTNILAWYPALNSCDCIGPDMYNNSLSTIRYTVVRFRFRWEEGVQEDAAVLQLEAGHTEQNRTEQFAGSSYKAAVPWDGSLFLNIFPKHIDTRWFKYDWDCLCVNKSQFVPVIFEPPCTYVTLRHIQNSEEDEVAVR